MNLKELVTAELAVLRVHATVVNRALPIGGLMVRIHDASSGHATARHALAVLRAHGYQCSEPAIFANSLYGRGIRFSCQSLR